jgi:hypothetical protein
MQMRSDHNWPRRSGIAIAAALAILAAAAIGCDGPRPTEIAANNGAATLNRAVDPEASDSGNAIHQEYDVAVELSGDRTRPVHYSYHVDRRHSPAGWRTHIDLRPDSRPEVADVMDRQVGGFDIDEAGNRTVLDRAGRPFAVTLAPELEARRNKARSRYPAAVTELLARVKTSGNVRGAKSRQAPAVVGITIRTKKQKDADIAALRTHAGGAPRVDTHGREHFARMDRGAPVDIAVDSRLGLITEVSRGDSGGEAAERVEYEYSDDGDRSIRRKIHLVRDKSRTAPASEMTISLSHIKLDGKEIKP